MFLLKTIMRNLSNEKVKNNLANVKNLHNFKRLDNMDNQADRVEASNPPPGFDETRCGQDVIGSQKELRQLPSFARRYGNLD